MFYREILSTLQDALFQIAPDMVRTRPQGAYTYLQLLSHTSVTLNFIFPLIQVVIQYQFASPSGQRFKTLK